ncbi:hypothetical protein YPPY45_2887, partial [Yersinia pestis PY-45]
MFNHRPLAIIGW